MFGYSFILTDIPHQPTVWIEHFHRHRAQIEERLKDTKLGQALRHLPSGDVDANRVWLTCVLLTLNLTALCCDLCPATGAAGEAPDDAPLRRTAATLRRILLKISARIIRTARRTILRLPQGFRDADVFQATLDAVYALPPPRPRGRATADVHPGRTAELGDPANRQTDHDTRLTTPPRRPSPPRRRPNLTTTPRSTRRAPPPVLLTEVGLNAHKKCALRVVDAIQADSGPVHAGNTCRLVANRRPVMRRDLRPTTPRSVRSLGPTSRANATLLSRDVTSCPANGC